MLGSTAAVGLHGLGAVRCISTQKKPKEQPPKVKRRLLRDIHKVQVQPPLDLDVPVEHMPEPTYESWVYNIANQKVGLMSLNSEIFGQQIRPDIIHQVVLWQLSKRRAGLAKAKNRAEVRGSNKKPHAQKGTGFARQGSTRAPHFVGGGRVHGPVVRSYEHKLNKKVRRLGLKVALSAKYLEGNLHILDSLETESHKTAKVLEKLAKWKYKHCLILHANSEMDPNFALAVRNVKSVHLQSIWGANVYDLVRKHVVIITVRGLYYLTRKLLRPLNSPNLATRFPAPTQSLWPYIDYTADPVLQWNREHYKRTLQPLPQDVNEWEQLTAITRAEAQKITNRDRQMQPRAQAVALAHHQMVENRKQRKVRKDARAAVKEEKKKVVVGRYKQKAIESLFKKNPKLVQKYGVAIPKPTIAKSPRRIIPGQFKIRKTMEERAAARAARAQTTPEAFAQ
jgi:large subunit ribosomal protein L4